MPGMDYDFTRMMGYTVRIRKFTGYQDAYGKREFGEWTEYPAHIQYGFERVFTPEGEEEISRGRIFIYGTPKVSTTDEMELPNGDRPRILNAEQWGDDQGDNYELVFFHGSRTI